MKLKSTFLGIASGVVLAGFFMPWVNFTPIGAETQQAGISAYQFLTESGGAKISPIWEILAWLIPFCAAYVLVNQITEKKILYDIHPVKTVPFPIMLLIIGYVYYLNAPQLVYKPIEVMQREAELIRLKQALSYGFYMCLVGSFIMFGYGVRYSVHRRFSGRLVELEGKTRH